MPTVTGAATVAPACRRPRRTAGRLRADRPGRPSANLLGCLTNCDACLLAEAQEEGHHAAPLTARTVWEERVCGLRDRRRGGIDLVENVLVGLLENGSEDRVILVVGRVSQRAEGI